MIQLLLSKKFEGFIGSNTAPVIYVAKFSSLNNIQPIDVYKFMGDLKCDRSTIEKFYLIQNSNLTKLYKFLNSELNELIDYLIVTPPEISEEELELDGDYRKYVEFKGKKVLLDRHTNPGESYYLLKAFLENIEYEMEHYGGVGILYLKNENKF